MTITLPTTEAGQSTQPTDLILTYNVQPSVVQVTIKNQGQETVAQFTMDIVTFSQMLKVLTDAVE